jgi:four helix bundle protein
MRTRCRWQFRKLKVKSEKFKSVEVAEKRYDIKIRCYEFSKQIVLFLDGIDCKRLFVPIVHQLLRSATSIGANVIEGKSGNSKKNLINSYSVALRSANETKYWLCLVRDTMKVNDTEVRNLIKEANEISKIIASSILKLKQTQK